MDQALRGGLAALEVPLHLIEPDGDAKFATRWLLRDCAEDVFPVEREPLPASIKGWPAFRSPHPPRGEEQQRQYERYGAALLTPAERFPDVHVVDKPPADATRALLRDDAARGFGRHKGYVWSHAGKLFSLGVAPAALGEFASLFTSLDEVTSAWVDEVRADLALLHPDQRLEPARARFAAWGALASRKYGFASAHWPSRERDADVDVIKRLGLRPIEKWELPPAAPRAATASFAVVREAIEEMWQRESTLSARALFVLEALRAAPGIAGPHPPRAPYVGGATFHLGAGVMATVNVWRFRSPATVVTRAYDAGDLVISVSRDVEELLEGSPALAGRRRRAAAAAESKAAAAAAAAEEEERRRWDDD